MKRSDLNALVDGIVPTVLQYVDVKTDPAAWSKQLAALVKDFVSRENTKLREDLERRMTALEVQKHIAYRGSHIEGGTYREGEMVTRSGVLWYCRGPETDSTPGHSSAWQMMHKTEGR